MANTPEIDLKLPSTADNIAEQINIDTVDNLTKIDNAIKNDRQQINTLAHPSFCSIKKTTNQSVPNSSYTKLTFNSETLDTNNMFDVASNTRITIKEAGIYLVVGTISYAINATGFRQSEIAKNGAVINDTITQSVASAVTSVVCTAILNCSVNDYIELFGRQNSGGALDAVTDTNLMVVKVGEV